VVCRCTRSSRVWFVAAANSWWACSVGADRCLRTQRTEHTTTPAHIQTSTLAHAHARLTALFPGLPSWAGTKEVNQSGFKSQQMTAVQRSSKASDGMHCCHCRCIQRAENQAHYIAWARWPSLDVTSQWLAKSTFKFSNEIKCPKQYTRSLLIQPNRISRRYPG